MSNDHTPTTEFVRRCATDEAYNGELLSRAEFDRWLAEHDRQTAEQAWGEGVTHAFQAIGASIAYDAAIFAENPYRKEQTDD